LKKHWYTDLVLVFVFFTWAMAFVFIKKALKPVGGFEPLAFVWPRMLLSAAILFALLPILKEAVRIPREHLMKTVAIGVVGLGSYHLLFTYALSLTTPVDTALIIGTGPVMTALWMPLFGMEKPSRRGWLGVIICFAMVVVIAVHGAWRDGTSTALTGEMGWNAKRLIGDLIMLVAANCWALNGILCRRALPYLPPITITAYGMLWASLLLIPFCTWSMVTQDWHAITATHWLYFAWAVLPASTISIVFYYFGVKTVGPLHTIIYQNISPTLTALTVLVMDHKLPSLVQGMGMVAIFLGVYLTRTSKGVSIVPLEST
jgi:drug/metabolite transporter (DMT)-like permease